MKYSIASKMRSGTCSGFTLVEVMVALAVIGVGIATVVGALTNLNSVASISRDYTGAFSVGQYQIDKLLSDAPFSPTTQNTSGNYEIPTVLTPGTTVENNIPIYQDPVSGTVVSGTRTTVVTTAPSTTYNGAAITLYGATVTINYTFRGKAYSYSMSTIRASDQ